MGVGRKRGGLILLLLSVAVLRVGFGINSPHGWWRAHLSDKAWRGLAKLRPWIFAISVLNGVFLVVGLTGLALDVEKRAEGLR